MYFLAWSLHNATVGYFLDQTPPFFSGPPRTVVSFLSGLNGYSSSPWTAAFSYSGSMHDRYIAKRRLNFVHLIFDEHCYSIQLIYHLLIKWNLRILKDWESPMYGNTHLAVNSTPWIVTIPGEFGWLSSECQKCWKLPDIVCPKYRSNRIRLVMPSSRWGHCKYFNQLQMKSHSIRATG